MTYLVTGGSGYFGSLLVKKLCLRGVNCKVFDINKSDEIPRGVEFIHGDIRDTNVVTDACAGVDVVLHNVAQVPLAKDMHLLESVNIGGMKNLLKACLHHHVKKVVYTSSSAVYGVPRELPVTEETSTNPAEAYGSAKAVAEVLCKEYVSKGMDISIVRPRTILGHGRLGIFQILFEWVSEGRRIPVIGNGDNIYQFVYADDLAEVCIRASEKQGSAVYNCGAEKYGTMRQLLQALCDHAGTGARVRSFPKKILVAGMKFTSKLGLSPLGDYHWLMYGENMYFDTSKIKTDLNYSANYSNEDMICQSYDWYIKNKGTIVEAGHGKSLHSSAVKQGILKVLKWLS